MNFFSECGCIRIGLFLSLALLISGCLNRIDLELPREERISLHIEAELVFGEDSSFLIIRTNTIFDRTAGSSQPVTPRSVHLFDEKGNRLEIPNVDRGVNLANIGVGEPVEVVLGGRYGIELVTQKGEVITSSLDQLLAAPEVIGLSAYRFQRDFFDRFEQIIKQPFIGLAIDLPTETKEKTARNFRFNFERTYRVTDNTGHRCYVSQQFNLDDEVTISTENLGQSSSARVPLLDVFIGPYFAEGCYLNVYSQSLTPDAYHYWSSIHALLNRTGNMFESPAGKIKSNFSYKDDPKREVFGLFYATQENVTRLFISPEFAEFPNTFCPVAAPAQLDVCDNCLSVQRSTSSKPFFWDEE